MTMQLMEKHIQNNPNLKLEFNQANENAKQWTEEFVKKKTATIVSIPVVFHVIHNTTLPEQNGPDSVLLSQLEVLNEDYRRLNSDTINTRAIFDSIAADVEVGFCLASIDPAGNPFSGIHRVETSETGFDIFGNMDAMKSTSSGGTDAWPADEYLNIWTCNMTIFGIPGSLLGFAQFPGDDPATDGVVIQYNYLGRTNDPVQSDSSIGRTATHEVGHWLGLRHIWADDGTIFGGATCDSSDFVDDTPNQEGESNFDCNHNINSCSNESAYWGTVNPPDMVENYMDYSSDSCMNLFTYGQKTRMLSFLNTDRLAILSSDKCGLLSVDNNSKSTLGIQVFPIPAKDILSVKFTKLIQGSTLSIINSLGQTILKMELVIDGNNITELDISRLKNGIYQLLVSNDIGIASKKLLVLR